MGVVYLATNKVNGKRYVGKTVHTMKVRRSCHESYAKAGVSYYLCRALRKYGFKNFEWKVVIETDDEDELNEVEMLLIRRWGTKAPNGYNMTDGGEGEGGRKQSLEEISKRVAKIIGRKNTQQTIDRMARKARGESNSQAILTERIVLKMRELRRKRWKVKDIAEIFEVPYSTAVCVINGDAWPHLPGAIKSWRARKSFAS